MKDIDRDENRYVTISGAAGFGGILALVVGPVLVTGFFLGYGTHKVLFDDRPLFDAPTLALGGGAALYL